MRRGDLSRRDAPARAWLRVERVDAVVLEPARVAALSLRSAPAGRGVRVRARSAHAGAARPDRQGDPRRGRLSGERSVGMGDRRDARRLGDGDGVGSRERAALLRPPARRGRHRGRVARGGHGRDRLERRRRPRRLRARAPDARDLAHQGGADAGRGPAPGHQRRLADGCDARAGRSDAGARRGGRRPRPPSRAA